MLDPEERRRHLYIVGQTGTGKSTLLLNLIAQDLAAGEGLALARSARRPGRSRRSVRCRSTAATISSIIDPADRDRPIGFNPLSDVPDELRPDRRRRRGRGLPPCLAG